MRRDLAELTGAHLLAEEPGDRYALHDLPRAYSGELSDDRAEWDGALDRLLAWYVRAADAARRVILPFSCAVPLPADPGTGIPAFGDVDTAMGWFEIERANVVDLIGQAARTGRHELAWKLAVTSGGFFVLRSYWSDWREIHLEALGSARAARDRLGIAASRLPLGDVMWREGEEDAALEHFLAVAGLGHELGNAFLEGFGLRGVGLVNEDLGRTEEARARYRNALTVFRSGGLERGAGMALLSLGNCATDGAAVPLYTEAVATFRMIGDTWSTAWGSLPLGRALLREGRVPEATTVLQEAVTVFRRFEDVRSEGLCLIELGEAHLAAGDSAAARTTWTSAAQILRSVADPQAESVTARIGELDG